MKYFLGFLAAVGLIVLVVIMIIRGFSGGDNTAQRDPLSNYASTDTIVRMTIDGPIVAEQQHTAYRITVGRSETRIETLKGYEYEILETKTYENNQQSYTNFLRALDLAGFTKGVENPSRDAQDERGVCATGNRYIYETISGTSQKQRLWATTCGSAGTFKGDKEKVQQLFDRQVPLTDFRKMTSRLSL